MLRWQSWVHLRGELFRSDWAADTAVHQSAQGRGVAGALRRAGIERTRHDRLADFDTSPVHEKVLHMQRDEHTVRRPLNVWLRPLNPWAFALDRLRASRGRPPSPARLRAALRLLRGARRTAAPAPEPTRGAIPRTIEAVDTFDDRATALWDRVAAGYDLARRRDAAWLNWRYADPRAGVISAYQLTEGDRLLGFAAFRRNHRDGTLLDLVTDPDESTASGGSAASGVATPLLHRGLDDLRRAGCRAVRTLLPPGHREAAALTAAGFHPTATRALEFQRRRGRNLPALLEVAADPNAAIHVTPGDFDHA